MKAARIGTFVAMTALMTLWLFGAAFAAELHESTADARQRVVLAPAQRDMMLAEMRLMLASVGRILQSLSDGDRPAAEKAARDAGIAGSADMDPHITSRLPRQFLEWAMHTHHGFDGLADRIKSGGSQADIIRGLATLTGNCVACHAVYRLDEAR